MKPGSEDEGSKQEAVSEETMEIALEVTEAMVTAVEMLEYLDSDSRVERVAAVHFFSQALAEDEQGPLPLHSPGHLPGLVQLLADRVHESAIAYENKAFLSINRLVHHYARILEPTETEMSNLEVAVKAVVCYIADTLPSIKDQDFRAISQLLPIIMDIFQEPGNLKKAQIHAAMCLWWLATNGGSYPCPLHILLIENGVMGMLMKTVRMGKESQEVLMYGFSSIRSLIKHGDYDLAQSALDTGILEVIEQVLKRPNYSDTPYTWHLATRCLLALCTWCQEQALDAILSSGLMELMLEMGLGMPNPKTLHYPNDILALMGKIGNEGQMRHLMSIGIFFRFLASHLNLDSGSRYYSFHKWVELVEACLAVPGTEHELRIRRRLIDDAGITDAIRRISRSSDPSGWDSDSITRHIFDTYLKDPLPPRPPSKLPSIIYTKNVPQ